MKLTLTRTKQDEVRSLGVLDAHGYTFHTIERPWVPHKYGPGGANRISCVPAGLYRVIPHHSAPFPNTYAIVNPELGVWYQPGDIPRNLQYGRCAILLHIANVVADVVGCIGVGSDVGQINGEPAVLRSKAAMRQLDLMLNRDYHTLEIT